MNKNNSKYMNNIFVFFIGLIVILACEPKLDTENFREDKTNRDTGDSIGSIEKTISESPSENKTEIIENTSSISNDLENKSSISFENKSEDLVQIPSFSKSEALKTNIDIEDRRTTGNILDVELKNLNERSINTVALSKSLAQKFNLSHLWTPMSCNLTRKYNELCSKPSEREFCVKALTEIDRLYCKLGGENREIASTIEMKFNTGDLISLWDIATKLCQATSNNSQTNLAARHLGIEVSQTKAVIAKTMVEKFLFGISDTDKENEISYIKTKLLNSTSDSDQFINSRQGRIELASKFQSMCTYLILNPKNLTY